MACMRYADVAVDAAVTHPTTFSYKIPAHLSVESGHLVWVPFGSQVLKGLVVGLSPSSPVAATRDILQVVEPSPLLGPVQLELGRWLSRYYRCVLFTALSLFLPPGFEAQVRSRLKASPEIDVASLGLKPGVAAALEALAARTSQPEREFLKALGRSGQREVNRLVERGVVLRTVSLPTPMAPRYESFLLLRDSSSADADLGGRQGALFSALQAHDGPYPARLANKEFGSGTAQALFDKGLVGMEWRRTEPNSLRDQKAGREQKAGPSFGTPRSGPTGLTLTPEQGTALADIELALDNPAHEPRSFLLHGVTGSGKTEVYLRAIDRVVRHGKRALFLVPEISLTPQTLERVNAWFPGRAALLHSRMTPRQQFDQWWNVREGRYDVVVGPRSALFAPLEDLGLIVIDEEHEWTYKQIESHPFYHARTVAMELSRLTGAGVVLGSATPDVESYYYASRGRHRLLTLPNRVGLAPVGSVAGAPELPGPGNEPAAARMAEVRVVDMRQELREGNREIFSRELATGLTKCIGEGRQAILFLNRRGAAPIVQCRDCGFVETCRRCSVSLTYHSVLGRLVCHQCYGRTPMPRQCRRCSGSHIRHLGVGTQRVVDEATKLLPGARIDRLDGDSTRSGHGLELAMDRLTRGETQVLVGTQMVAKGLDVPNVSLVGVVLADIGLFLPDFRAGERTFSLLCQVAGRAGRGGAPGRAIIQTYNPEHYAVRAAGAQDYSAVYPVEIESRRQLGNPPFNRMVHLIFHNSNRGSAQRQAAQVRRELDRRAFSKGLADVDVSGPAPGVPERVRGRYRWRLLLRGQDLHDVLEGMDLPAGCTVDVDPVHLL